MSYHFKYSLTLEEYEEYSLFTAWDAPWQKKTKQKFLINNTLFSALIMVATYLVLEKIGPPRKRNLEVLLILFSISLFIVVLLNYYNVPYRLKKRARKFIETEDNQNLLYERDFELTDEQISITIQGSTSYLKWESVTKYAVSENHFYLYTNSESAYLIPKRLFSTQSEINQFDKFVLEKVPLSASFRSIRS
ncbi:MAG: YcxB family protein [Chitinophagales bacterium]|nr:YcxB family protein [Chitinophagales bacterium]